MDTADSPPNRQQEQQQERGIMKNHGELHGFVLDRDPGSPSTSNLGSLAQTTLGTGGQPQESTPSIAAAPMKLGRPKKRATLAPPVGDENARDPIDSLAPPAKKLGRPKKSATLAPPVPEEQDHTLAADIATPPKKRGPGRPRKYVTYEMQAGEVAMEGAEEEGKDTDYIDPSERNKTPTKNQARPKKRVTYEMAEPKTKDAGEEAGGVAAAEEESTKEIYVRPIARYVAPPAQEKPPGLREVYFAFQREKMAYEEDPFSAYAFGGPRHRKPFRMLQNIGDPHEKDIMGWAENLRWAHEQWKFFPDAIGNTGWNESPEQMEMIAKIREEQVWLSDELLAYLNKPEKKVKKMAAVEEMEY